MNIQDYVTNAINASRKATLDKSDQLTVGELLLKLQSLMEKHKENKNEPTVSYDFENLFPTSIDSWRGSYAELALNFKSTGMPMTISAFYQMIQDCIGKTFEGYKGGYFVMGKTTPIWIANHGNVGSTALIDVVDAKWEIILITGYREY